MHSNINSIDINHNAKLEPKTWLVLTAVVQVIVCCLSRTAADSSQYRNLHILPVKRYIYASIHCSSKLHGNESYSCQLISGVFVYSA